MKISKIKRVVMLLGIVGLFAACTDLNQEKPGSFTNINYFRNETDAMRSVNAAFSDLKDYRYTWGLWCFGDVLSADATYSGSDADVTGYARMEAFDYHSDNGRIGNRWTLCNRAINKANQAIHGIEAMNENLFPSADNKGANYKNRLVGEVRFLRAYMYHELVKAFGDVPLLVNTPTPKDKYMARTAKEKVYDQIVDDLTFAANNLPKVSEIGADYKAKQAGRITQGAAYAMLGRVLLYQEKYEESKAASLAVISSNEYELVENYGDQFTLAGEHGKESILEINQYDSPNMSGASNNNGNFHVLMMLPFGATYGYGINQPTKELADAFNEIGDEVRRDATMLTPEMIKETESAEDFAKLDRNRTGFYNKKFYLPPSQRAKEIRNNPVNFRLIRLAEVYLNYAEACVKRGNDAEAHTYLKLIRERVGLPAITGSGDELYDNIIKERRLELAGEGFRYWDVVRVGKAVELFQSKGKFTVNKNELFPIPQSDIDISKNAIVQNNY